MFGEGQFGRALADEVFEILIQVEQFVLGGLQVLFVAGNLLVDVPGAFEKKSEGGDHHKGKGVYGTAVRSYRFPGRGIVPDDQDLLENVAG